MNTSIKCRRNSPLRIVISWHMSWDLAFAIMLSFIWTSLASAGPHVTQILFGDFTDTFPVFLRWNWDMRERLFYLVVLLTCIPTAHRASMWGTGKIILCRNLVQDPTSRAQEKDSKYHPHQELDAQSIATYFGETSAQLGSLPAQLSNHVFQWLVQVIHPQEHSMG